MLNEAGAALRVVDAGVARDTFLEDVVRGLSKPQKSIPSKYFYDRRGSELFDEITQLDEYYPTRTELGIMQESVGEMAEAVGPGVMLVEYGSGSSLKTRILLDHLEKPVAYVPVDISRGHLLDAADRLAYSYPNLEIMPVVADYTQNLTLPRPKRSFRRVVGYFPGSTIGNFEHAEIAGFLQAVATEVGEKGGLLIGVDLKKDREVLRRAYNDARGVTAEFNVNVLRRINRELGGDFVLDRFAHLASWNEEKGRIEMHLRSLVDQTVTVGERRFELKEGETIHTENSHKFSLDEFAGLAKPWFRQRRVWVDREKLFSVQYLETANTEYQTPNRGPESEVRRPA